MSNEVASTNRLSKELPTHSDRESAGDTGGTEPQYGGAQATPRILLCTDYLPPSDGGVEQVVEQLACELTNRGHEVGVFTLSSRSDSIDLYEHSDIQVFTSRKFDLTKYLGLQSAVSVPAVRDFRRVLSQFDPDIVHVHNRFFYTSYLALLYKTLKRYPLVTTLHLGQLENLDGPGGAAARAFQTVLARRLVRSSDAVVCVSKSVEAVASSLGARWTTTNPNAVDLNQFSVPQSTFDKTLLYVGRLVRNNGPQDLVRATPGILREHPDAQIHIVGDGTLKSDLHALVDELSVAESVTIHGFVDQLLPMYEAADVFCRPSYSEGLPLTLLEAMATYSVPVVTPVAGSREVLTDGETGQFVEVGNPVSITANVNQLFNRPDDVARLAANARTYVESRHDWETRTENVIRVYNEILTNE